MTEIIGQTSTTTSSTLHYPKNGAHGQTGHEGGKGVFTSASDLHEDFHVYAVEWEATEIRFYMDDNEVLTVTKDGFDGDWQFDKGQKFYVIFNLAIGGEMGGAPDVTTTDGELEVDWIRIFQ